MLTKDIYIQSVVQSKLNVDTFFANELQKKCPAVISLYRLSSKEKSILYYIVLKEDTHEIRNTVFDVLFAYENSDLNDTHTVNIQMLSIDIANSMSFSNFDKIV